MHHILSQSEISHHNARVDFHILKLFGGLFRSPEGGQSQYSPARKITNMFYLLLRTRKTVMQRYLQNCGTKFDPRATDSTKINRPGHNIRMY